MFLKGTGLSKEQLSIPGWLANMKPSGQLVEWTGKNTWLHACKRYIEPGEHLLVLSYEMTEDNMNVEFEFLWGEKLHDMRVGVYALQRLMRLVE